MAKLSRKELSLAQEEEELLQEDIFWREESDYLDKNEDFNIIEETYGQLDSTIKIEHQWLDFLERE